MRGGNGWGRVVDEKVTQQACEDALHRSAMAEEATWLIVRRRRTPSAFRSCLSCSGTHRVD
jgi:hypothetical protein